MSTPLAQSIRRARLAVGLTQEQLAQRMGLKLQAVYRWEADHTRPSKRNMNMLLSVISVLNGPVAARLSTELNGLRLMPKERAVAEPVLAAPADRLPGRHAVELAVMSMADELDLSPKRVRAALVRLCKRLLSEGLSLEDLQRQLAAAQLEREALDDVRGEQV